jgi:hypothetical protein
LADIRITITVDQMGLWWRRNEMSEARLIEAAEALARVLELSPDEQASALQRDGFSESEAWRLVELLPLAFSRPVLEDLGVRHFVKKVTATRADGTSVVADLTRQPEYTGALKLARRHRRKAVMNHDVYKRIAETSAEIDAVSNALNQGADVCGGTVGSSLVGPEIARHLLR